MELVFGPDPEFPDDAEAAYRRIAKGYRDRIAAGDLADGERLPSERELCERHGVSAITARAAVNLLREWGLVYGVRGKGVFVRRPVKLTRVAPARYHRHQPGRTYQRESATAGVPLEAEHHTARAAASAAVARRLGIEEGADVMVTTYRFRSDGKPVTISTSYEPLALTGGTPIEHPHQGPLGSEGIVTRFDAIGLHVNEVEEVLTVRSARAEEARHLEIASATVVVEIEQTFRVVNTDGEAIAVETANIVFPADQYELRYVMTIR